MRPSSGLIRIRTGWTGRLGSDYPPRAVVPPIEPAVFTVLAVLALGSAGVVAFSKNIVHSALALLGTFLGVAGLYITLSADFLAATQILVYVGGTLTLILFAVMLTAKICLLYTSPSPRDLSTSRMPSSA